MDTTGKSLFLNSFIILYLLLPHCPYECKEWKEEFRKNTRILDQNTYAIFQQLHNMNEKNSAQEATLPGDLAIPSRC